ncbi:MAG: hypothetical protein ACK559_17775, partial [bacterium]
GRAAAGGCPHEHREQQPREEGRRGVHREIPEVGREAAGRVRVPVAGQRQRQRRPGGRRREIDRAPGPAPRALHLGAVREHVQHQPAEQGLLFVLVFVGVLGEWLCSCLW